MILLVEDNLDLRHAYEIVLQMSGFRVTSFMDGTSVLQHLSEHEAPGLVILDINLPDIDGLTLLAQIRETPVLKKVPVIIASAQPQRKNEALALGADAFITKGVDDMQQLIETARRLTQMA